MNYNEFAEKIKAKYPEYSDMDNMELAKKIVNKYPNDYNDVIFDTPQQPKEQTKTVINTPVEKPKEESKPHFNNDFTESHILEGGIEKRVTPNWDEKGRVFYTDENGNKVELQKAPLGTRIKNWGIAKADNIGNWLNSYSYDPNGNAPVDKMYRDKSKVVAALTTLPFGGMGAEALGLTGLAKMATAGALDGGIYGLSSGLIDKKDAKGILGETALNAGLGSVIGLGFSAAAPYAKKVVNFLGEKASPIIKNVAEKLGNKIEKTPIQAKTPTAQTFEQSLENINKKTDNLIPTLSELKDNIQKSKFSKANLQVLKRSKQGHYWSKTLDTAENDYILATREFNDIITDIYKDPSKILDETYFSSLENKVDDLINHKMPFNEDPEAVSEFYDKFYAAVDNAMSYSNLKNGNFSYFTGLGEQAKRSLQQSIIKAKGTPKDIKNFFKKNIPEYSVLHNNELTEKAVQEIEANFENEYNRLITSDTFDSLDFEKSRQIAKRLFGNNDYVRAVNLIDRVSEEATKKGQAIQALSLWSNMTPEGAVYKAEKLIQQYNRKMGKKLALTPEQIDNIRKLQQEAMSAADEYSKTVGFAKTAKYISELVPKGIGKKLKAYRNLSLLLNPKTLGRNIIGNALFNAVDTVSKAAAVPIDRAIGLVTKQKTRVLPQIGESISGAIKGTKKGFSEALQGIDTRGLGQRFDLDSGRTFTNPVMKNLETALDIGLRVPDRTFYEGAFAESVKNQMLAKGLQEPTQEILEQAEKEALEAVFQDKSKISDLALGARRAFNKIGIENFGLGDALIPYAQTPANLVQQGINYSPLGFVKGLSNLAQGNQRQASLDLARGLLGSGIIGSGYALGKNKLATPTQFDENYQTNKKIKDNLAILGIRPDQIGDLWYSPFQPMSIPLSAGVAISENENPLQAGLNTITDLPFLQSYNRLMKDIQDKGVVDAGVNFAGSIPSQFVPTLLSQTAQTVDPYQRETYDKNKIKQGLNQSVSRIPFASKLLPKKYDVTGKPIERYSSKGVQRLVDIFVNPTYINKKTKDPVISELKALYDITGETSQFLPTVDKNIKFTDKQGEEQKLQLSGEQLSAYQKALGENLYKALYKRMQTPEYLRANDDERIDLIRQTKEETKAFVEEQLFNKKNKFKKVYKPKDPAAKLNKIKNKANKMSLENIIYNDVLPDIQNIESINK